MQKLTHEGSERLLLKSWKVSIGARCKGVRSGLWFECFVSGRGSNVLLKAQHNGTQTCKETTLKKKTNTESSHAHTQKGERDNMNAQRAFGRGLCLERGCKNRSRTSWHHLPLTCCRTQLTCTYTAHTHRERRGAAHGNKDMNRQYF